MRRHPADVCSDDEDFRTHSSESSFDLRRIICLALFLSAGWTSLLSAADDSTTPAIGRLLSQLTSDRFSERVAAQKELAEQAASRPEVFAEAYANAGPEERARLRQLLETVFISCPDDRGDRAEQALMAMEEGGSPAAQAILMGNARLRESRALAAVDRLGADLIYIYPGSDVPRSPPPLLAPLVGIGFGEPAQLKAILIPENWTGTLKDLWHFERLSHHQNLAIYSIRGNQLSPDDLLQLTSKLAGSQVIIRGACLGIVAMSGSMTADVGKVVENSAAAEAGIRPRDRILQLNETPVRNFSHLIELLTDFHPHDQVKLHVSRDDSVQEIPVTLASWKGVIYQELHAIPPPTPFPGPLGIGTPPPPELPQPEMEHQPFITPENN